MNSVFDFSVKDISGIDVPLSSFKGRFLLIVNTASKCGFSSQYSDLEALYVKYKDYKNGLTVLAFPCNQFANQEPLVGVDILNHCQANYAVTFPVFDKINVIGDKAHPLFVFLCKQQTGVMGTEFIKWNFTKFLVNPDGDVIKRFAPKDSVDKIDAFFSSLV